MQKMSINGNSFYNGSRKSFRPMGVSPSLLQQVTDFAYDMCFGEGHHRHHRTGGTIQRRAGEQFCNTFQGKLAEVVLRRFLISKGFKCAEPDFNVFGKGIWDDTDLIINGKSISVKSAAHFSNLLLLESKDYDNNGNYLPNLSIGATARYDFYVLVRISPDIKGVFRKLRLMYSDRIDKQTIESIIKGEVWNYDIAGWITHEEFVSIIRNGHIIPKDALLNGKTRMDAENYYVQSGDMHDIEKICQEL